MIIYRVQLFNILDNNNRIETQLSQHKGPLCCVDQRLDWKPEKFSV